MLYINRIQKEELLDNENFTDGERAGATFADAADSMRRIRFWRANTGRFSCVFMLVTAYFLLFDKYDALPLALLLLSGLGAILFLSWKSQAVFFTLLGFITCTECHFILHYGEPFRVIGQQVLLTLQITNSDEVTTYLKMLRPLAVALPVLFVSGVFLICKWRKKPLVRMPPMTAFGVFLLLGWLTAYNSVPPVAGYFENWDKRAESHERRLTFQFGAYDLAPETPSLYILVIGESHRQDHFDEYLTDSEFAPRLFKAKEDGVLFNFTDVISPYPQTWFSVFTLLTRRSTDNRNPDWPEKGLPWLFREAGYHVAFITYQEQGEGDSGYDGVVGECDEYFNHREITPSARDDGMIGVIEDIVAKKRKKQLIIIKMAGCHFNYYDRHTEKHVRFTPAASENDFRLDPEDPFEILKMKNSYKNATLASAEFLDGVARIADEHNAPSMLCFVSDHGITNFDDGKNPYFGTAKSSYAIPLFFYPNSEWRTKYLTRSLAAKLYSRRNAPMTNSCVFETLVSLANLDYTNKRRSELDITSNAFTPQPLRSVWVWDTQRDYNSLENAK